MAENDRIKEVRDAWAWIRKNNQSIPDDILDLMKDSAIEKIEGENNKQHLDILISSHDDLSKKEGILLPSGLEYIKGLKQARKIIFGEGI
jgi:hypothetical protein